MYREPDEDLDASHPRYASIKLREKLVAGFRAGMVVPQGLIAHGRGEMFDYLLGERTLPQAQLAERAAAAALLLADRTVISVNGNLAALCAGSVVKMAEITGARIEVNLFHWDEDRVVLIREILERNGATGVLAENPDCVLEGISHARRKCHSEGVFSADVVLVPLEDGDRASALARMGKSVISVDLNPLSRTSLSATISIIDEVSRAIPNIGRFANELRDDREECSRLLESYDNDHALKSIFLVMIEHLESLPVSSDFEQRLGNIFSKSKRSP